MIRTLSRLALPALAILAVGATVLVRHSVAVSAMTWVSGENITTTYQVSGAFSDISISTPGDAAVRFRPSTDGTVSVVSYEPEALSASYSVTVENGVLTVSNPTTGIGYLAHADRGDRGRCGLTVYLPEGDYGNLHISASSGDIKLPAGFSFSAAGLDSGSGDIELSGSVTGALVCNTGSGDVELNGPLAGSVEVDTGSGEVDLQNLTTQSVRVDTASGEVGLERVSVSGDIRIDTTSGDVDLEGTTAGGSIEIDTTSGDIELERSDAASLRLTASSGEIKAELLTAKNFRTDTGSGRVRVSGHDPAAGLCEMRTTSGSITASVRQ